MGKIGHIVIDLEEVDSTNLYAERMIRKGEVEEGTVISARYQTAGMGQGENRWESAPGQNLTFSVILHPRFLTPDRQFLINKIVTLGVTDFVSSMVDDVAVKWPNDIFIGSRKIGGILIRHMVEGDSLEASIVGIGINVNQTRFDHHLTQAASLFQILHHEMKLKEALLLVCDAIEARYFQFKRNEIQQLDSDFYEVLLGYREERPFLVNGQETKGIIQGVDAFGRLLVEHPGKPLKTYAHKEIEYLL